MYECKNILVTGCCGFIGSNFVNNFLKNYENINIYNIDKIDYCAREKNVICVENYKFIKGDIKSVDLINFILNQYQIDTIIHFAAQSHVDNSFGNSIEFTNDNVLGTHTLLECCRIYNKIKRFIHVSTDEVYGEVEENETCSENSLLNPTNPYAASKAAAEFLVRSYGISFKLPIIITRGNNVYGPLQYPEKLIPKFIFQILDNKKCTIHGKGETVRNFIYIDDVSTAFEKILFFGKIGQIYNIGTQNEYSVLQITQKLIDILKPDGRLDDYIEYVEDRKFNDKRYSICNKKLLDLGWKEETEFNKGLQKTVEWYINNRDYWL